jgi:hypothetical protein
MWDGAPPPAARDEQFLQRCQRDGERRQSGDPVGQSIFFSFDRLNLFTKLSFQFFLTFAFSPQTFFNKLF